MEERLHYVCKCLNIELEVQFSHHLHSNIPDVLTELNLTAFLGSDPMMAFLLLDAMTKNFVKGTVSDKSCISSVIIPEFLDVLPLSETNNKAFYYSCGLCSTPCFVCASSLPSDSYKIFVFISKSLISDRETISKLRATAQRSWFSVVLDNTLPVTEQDLQDNSNPKAAAIDTLFEELRENAELEFQNRLNSLVQAAKQAHALSLLRAQHELRRLKSHLGHRNRPTSIQVPSNKTKTSELPVREGVDVVLDPVASSPEPEIEGEVAEPPASRRGIVGRMHMAQSAPVQASRLSEPPGLLQPLQTSNTDLPGSGDFKKMTDAERLYTMQAMSYRFTASVREHEQFGRAGPPHLQELQAKAKHSRLGAHPEDEESEEQSAAEDDFKASSEPVILRASNVTAVYMAQDFKKF